MEDRRIKSPGGYYTVGIIGLFVAFLAYQAPRESYPVGPIAFAIAISTLVFGFWVSLFGSIEQRLIDIQELLIRASAKTDDEQRS